MFCRYLISLNTRLLIALCSAVKGPFSMLCYLLLSVATKPLSLFYRLLLLKRKTVIRSNLPLKCLKKPILILNQPWQCCIVILPYFVAKKGGKEIKKFALLSSFLVSWSLTSVYIGRRKPVQNNGYIGLKSFLWKHFNDNASLFKKIFI